MIEKILKAIAGVIAVFAGSYSLVAAATILYPGGGGTGWGYPGGIQAHTVLIGNGTNPISTTSPNTAGYVLTSNGVGSDPSFQPATGGGGGSGTVGTSSSETAGYFPTWTSNSGTPALLAGTSQLFQSGTNIGIGTTTPNWNLEVAGTRPTIALSDFSDGANLRHWLLSSQAGFLYFSSSTDAFATSTFPNLTLSNTTGRNGFDTAQPNSILEVAGTGANTDFRVSRQNNQTTYFGVSAPGGSNTASNFYINGTNIMTLSSSGNVGIATGTPAALLDVAGTGASTDFRVTRPNTGNFFHIFAPHGSPVYASLGVNGSEILDFADGTNKFIGVGSTTPWGLFSINPTSTIGTAPQFVVGSSTGTNLIVTNGGFVGIGTTTPAALLTVQDGVANGLLLGQDTSAPANSERLFFQGSAGTYAIYDVNGTLTFNSGATPTVGSGSQLMVLTSGGNLGIATATPVYPLNVGGSGELALFGSSAANSYIGFSGFLGTGTGNDGRAYYGMDITNGNAVVQGGNTRGIEFNVNNTTFGKGTAAVITSGGNFGIGTTSPFAQLSVAGASGGTTPLFAVASSSAAFSTTTVFEIDQNGNVTVTTAADDGFKILSTASNHIALFENTGSGSAHASFCNSVTGCTTSQGTDFGIDPSGNARILDHSNTGFRLLVNQSTEAFDVLSTGNVGVSSTTPGSLLSIGTSNGINFSTATSTFSSTGGINLASGCFAINGVCVGGSGTVTSVSGSGGTTGLTLTGGPITTSGTLTLGGTLGIANGGTGTTTGGVTNGVEYYNGTTFTNGSNFVFNGTNVGIGTTTPGSLFSLGGLANLTTATSTFYSSGGINLTTGCFAVNGICVGSGGGSGTVSSGTAGQIGWYANTGTTITGTSTININTSTGAITIATSTTVGSTNIFAIGKNQTIYSTNGSYTFTLPNGITNFCYQVVGGGGGGGGNNQNAGGGGGGYASGCLSTTTNMAITVGAGATHGGNGGNSTIGGVVTANGGSVGGGSNSSNTTITGGNGGTASGGQLNLTGGSGGDTYYNGTFGPAGNGGGNPLGFGGGGSINATGKNGTGCGGAGGGSNGGFLAGNGSDGCVIISY